MLASLQLLSLNTGAAAAFTEPKPVSLPAKISLADIQIPASLGIIETKNIKPNQKIIIHIQDAHAIPQAQKAIFELIQYLQTQYGISVMGIEGAEGPLDSTLLKSFPDEETLRSVLKQYLDAGELSGAAVAAVLNKQPASAYGIEDWQYFEKGTAAFLQALELKPQLDKKVHNLRSALQALKRRFYSPKAFALDGIFQNYKDNKIQTIEFLQRLFQHGLPDPVRYRYLYSIYQAAHESSLQDQSSLDIEVRKLADQVRAQIQSSDIPAEFNAQYQDFLTGKLSPGEFAARLQKLVGHKQDGNFEKSFSSRLKSLVRNYDYLAEAKSRHFSEELALYEQEVKTRLLKTAAEKSLNFYDREITKIEKLSRLELNAAEWQGLITDLNRADRIKTQPISYFEKRLQLRMEDLKAQVKGYFKTFLDFYDISTGRDAVFADKIHSILNRQKTEALILVSGGFHADGLAEKIKEQGYGYYQISPRFEGFPDESHYWNQMQGKVSWRKFFKKQNGELDLFQAFHEAVFEKLIDDWEKGNKTPSPEVKWFLLKKWRDQLLRLLARQNRLNDAGAYLSFFVTYAQSSPVTETMFPWLRNQWTSRISDFFGRIETLQHENKLTKASLQQSMRFASSMPPAAVASFVRGSRLKIASGFSPQTAARSELRGESRSPSFRKFLDIDTIKSVQDKVAQAENVLQDRMLNQDFNDFFHRFFLAVPIEHLLEEKSTPAYLAEQVVNGFELLTRFLSDPAFQPQISIFTPLQSNHTEIGVAAFDRSQLEGDITSAIGQLGASIAQSYSVKVEKTPTGKMIVVSIYELINPRTEGPLDAQLVGQIKDKLEGIEELRVISGDSELKVEGHATIQNRIVSGDVAVLRNLPGGIKDVAYDLFWELRQNGSPDMDPKAMRDILQKDIEDFDDEISHFIATEQQIAGSMRKGDQESVKTAIAYLQILHAQTLRRASKALGPKEIHRRSARSTFLDLATEHLESGEENGDPVVQETIRRAIEALRSNFSFINTSDSDMPLEEQRKLVERELNDFNQALFKVLGKTVTDESLGQEKAEAGAEQVSHIIMQLAEKIRHAISYENIIATRAIDNVVSKKLTEWRGLKSEKWNSNANEVERIFIKIILQFRQINPRTTGLRAIQTASNTILFASQLDPFELLDLIQEYPNIVAIVSDHGSLAAHWVQVALNRGIVVLILKDAAEQFDLTNEKWMGAKAIIDSSSGNRSGYLVLNPSKETREYYAPLIDGEDAFYSIAKMHSQKEAKTESGQVIKFLANADNADEVAEAFENGAQGIGLVRTEYFFGHDNHDLQTYIRQPTAENRESLIMYLAGIFRDMAAQTTNGSLVIRMFDMERDKPLSIPNELQMFGPDYYRTAVGRDLLDIELEAAIRAQIYLKNIKLERSIKIMFPGYRGSEDLRRILQKQDLKKLSRQDERKLAELTRQDILDANKMFEAAKKRVQAYFQEKYEETVDAELNKIQRGFMIESQEGAQLIRFILENSDFISLGTNDLTQSLYRDEGISRDNEDHAGYFETLQPRVLTAVQDISRELERWNRSRQAQGLTEVTLSICGALAGVHEFALFLTSQSRPFVEYALSVPPRLIPVAKEFIRGVAADDSKIFPGVLSDPRMIHSKAAEKVSEIFRRIKKSPAFMQDLEKVQPNEDSAPDQMKVDQALDEQVSGERVNLAVGINRVEIVTSQREELAGNLVTRNFKMGSEGMHFLPATKMQKILSKAEYAGIQAYIGPVKFTQAIDVVGKVMPGEPLTIQLQGSNADKAMEEIADIKEISGELSFHPADEAGGAARSEGRSQPSNGKIMKSLNRLTLPLAFAAAYGAGVYWDILPYTILGMIPLMIWHELQLRKSVKQKADDLFLEKEGRYLALWALLEHLPHSIFVKDANSKFMIVNRRFASIYRREPEQMIGTTDFDYSPPEVAAAYQEADREILAGSIPKIFEEKHVVHDQPERDVEVVKAPIFGPDGKALGLVGIFMDITDRKNVERDLKVSHEQVARTLEELQSTQMQLMRSEQLVTAGKLAAGIAHNFRNFLGGIQGFASFILEDLEKPSFRNLPASDFESLKSNAGNIIEAVTGVNDMVSSLLSLSRPGKDKFSQVSLDRVIHETLRLQTGQMRKKSLDLQAAEIERGLTFMGDQGQIMEVLLNLINNAADAIAMRNDDLPGVIRLQAHQESSRIYIRITDSGIGLKPEQHQKLFEPFESTKGDKGTGIGLWSSRLIIERHGGSIKVLESEIGKGTTFEIILPAGENDTVSTKASESTDKAAGNKQELQSEQGLKSIKIKFALRKALIVEDSEVNRKYAVRFFASQFGIKDPTEMAKIFLTAESLDQAKHLYEANPDIEWIITDFHLGDGTAEDVIHYVRTHSRKRVPVLALTSGHSYGHPLVQGISNRVDFIFKKPFESETVENAIPKIIAQIEAFRARSELRNREVLIPLSVQDLRRQMKDAVNEIYRVIIQHGPEADARLAYGKLEGLIDHFVRANQRQEAKHHILNTLSIDSLLAEAQLADHAGDSFRLKIDTEQMSTINRTIANLELDFPFAPMTAQTEVKKTSYTLKPYSSLELRGPDGRQVIFKLKNIHGQQAYFEISSPGRHRHVLPEFQSLIRQMPEEATLLPPVKGDVSAPLGLSMKNGQTVVIGDSKDIDKNIRGTVHKIMPGNVSLVIYSPEALAGRVEKVRSELRAPTAEYYRTLEGGNTSVTVRPHKRGLASLMLKFYPLQAKTESAVYYVRHDPGDHHVLITREVNEEETDPWLDMEALNGRVFALENNLKDSFDYENLFRISIEDLNLSVQLLNPDFKVEVYLPIQTFISNTGKLVLTNYAAAIDLRKMDVNDAQWQSKFVRNMTKIVEHNRRLQSRIMFEAIEKLPDYDGIQKILVRMAEFVAEARLRFDQLALDDVRDSVAARELAPFDFTVKSEAKIALNPVHRENRIAAQDSRELQWVEIPLDLDQRETRQNFIRFLGFLPLELKLEVFGRFFAADHKPKMVIGRDLLGSRPDQILLTFYQAAQNSYFVIGFNEPLNDEFNRAGSYWQGGDLSFAKWIENSDSDKSTEFIRIQFPLPVQLPKQIMESKPVSLKIAPESSKRSEVRNLPAGKFPRARYVSLELERYLDLDGQPSSSFAENAAQAEQILRDFEAGQLHSLVRDVTSVFMKIGRDEMDEMEGYGRIRQRTLDAGIPFEIAMFFAVYVASLLQDDDFDWLMTHVQTNPQAQSAYEEGWKAVKGAFTFRVRRFLDLYTQWAYAWYAYPEGYRQQLLFGKVKALHDELINEDAGRFFELLSFSQKKKASIFLSPRNVKEILDLESKLIEEIGAHPFNFSGEGNPFRASDHPLLGREAMDYWLNENHVRDFRNQLIPLKLLRSMWVGDRPGDIRETADQVESYLSIMDADARTRFWGYVEENKPFIHKDLLRLITNGSQSQLLPADSNDKSFVRSEVRESLRAVISGQPLLEDRSVDFLLNSINQSGVEEIKLAWISHLQDDDDLKVLIQDQFENLPGQQTEVTAFEPDEDQIAQLLREQIFTVKKNTLALLRLSSQDIEKMSSVAGGTEGAQFLETLAGLAKQGMKVSLLVEDQRSLGFVNKQLDSFFVRTYGSQNRTEWQSARSAIRVERLPLGAEGAKELQKRAFINEGLDYFAGYEEASTLARSLKDKQLVNRFIAYDRVYDAGRPVTVPGSLSKKAELLLASLLSLKDRNLLRLTGQGILMPDVSVFDQLAQMLTVFNQATRKILSAA